MQDLNTIILLEPNNKAAQTDLQKLKKQLHIEDVGKKFRMPIHENDQVFITKSMANKLNESKKSLSMGTGKFMILNYLRKRKKSVACLHK